MVNSEAFVLRLEKIMDYYGLSASAFADSIGVQRSSISHLLSGRNKPSLEFVMKVIGTYQEVNLYWLLNGKGSFPSTLPPGEGLPDNSSNKQEKKVREDKRCIEKIVIFYNDGSFESYDATTRLK